MSRETKKKIAILGGGAGSLTAAMEITSAPDWRERYDVTVYQMGWRLGGKGASGRNPAHNQRIEEHGLHIWMGFYRNAFRVMQQVYDEIRERGIEPYPYKHVSEAFDEQTYIALQESVDGEWRTWGEDFPRIDGHPWDPGDPLPDGRAILLRMLDFSRLLCERLRGQLSDVSDDEWKVSLDIIPASLRELLPGVVDENMGSIGPSELLRAAWHVLDATDLVWKPLEQLGERLVERLVQETHDILRRIERIGELGDGARRIWMQADLALTHTVGILVDDILKPHGDRRTASYEDWLVNLQGIEHHGYREWLRRHNASERTIDSAFVRGMEGLVFLHRAEGGAGTAINGLARMFFAYSGSIFYKMKGGMGDIIFSPLYDVLRARGVRFEFFHRVQELVVGDDGTTVDGIRMRRQVTLRDGDEYHPLVDIKGMRCWPSAPDQEQIVEDITGHNLEAWDCPLAAEERYLERGQDFDMVVLGISLGALTTVGGQLLTRGRPWANHRWRDLTTRVETTATQAMQLWLKDDLEGLGWNEPSPILGAYERPIDTWADMTHLAEHEDWHGRELGHIAYFCGPLDPPDDDLPHDEALAKARSDFMGWVDRNLEPIMPNMIDRERGGVRWSRLVADPDASTAEEHWDAQYYRVNTEATDRYVLSVPDSAHFRLRADESGYDNLVLAGDWLRTSINAGCVEAAIMGGLQAGKAITGQNSFTVIGDPELRVPGMPSGDGSERSQPRYIERLGEQVLGHPFVMQGTRMHGFLIRCDKERMQAICDQHLNLPRIERDPSTQARWGYQVVAPYAAFMVADMPHMISTHANNRDKGIIDEIDAALWVPVVKWERHHGVRIPREQFWFLPYVFVNRAISVSGGREIMGFFKNYATMDLKMRDGDLESFDLSAFAIPRFARDARARQTPIVRIEHRHERHGSRILDWLDDLGQTLERKLSSALARNLVPLVQRLMGRHLPMVFLKQFRDSEKPSRACYQAIVEGAMLLTELEQAYLLDEDEYRLTLEHVDSIPLTEMLGVPAGPQEIIAAWSVHGDISMETGRAVWSAD